MMEAVPNMIESFVPGRVRLRSRLLRDPGTAEFLKRSLLEYDAALFSLPVLMRAMPLFERLQALEEKTGDILQDADAILRELKSLLEGE